MSIKFSRVDLTPRAYIVIATGESFAIAELLLNKVTLMTFCYFLLSSLFTTVEENGFSFISTST